MKILPRSCSVGLLLLVCVFSSRMSMPQTTNSQENRNKGRVLGSVVSHLAADAVKYTILVKLKECDCEKCTVPCKDCCIPQMEVDSDERGKFQLSLGPGTYFVQVKGRESSRVEIEVSPGESKAVTLTAD